MCREILINLICGPMFSIRNGFIYWYVFIQVVETVRWQVPGLHLRGGRRTTHCNLLLRCHKWIRLFFSGWFFFYLLLNGTFCDAGVGAFTAVPRHGLVAVVLADGGGVTVVVVGVSAHHTPHQVAMFSGIITMCTYLALAALPCPARPVRAFISTLDAARMSSNCAVRTWCQSFRNSFYSNSIGMANGTKI